MSMLKFVGGPTIGAAVGLSYWETILFTVLGMMTTVVIISYFGKNIRHWYYSSIFKNRMRRKFTKSNRRFVFIWRKYGILGVSFLTPVFFSPILGTLLVITFGGPKKLMFIYMFLSAVFWALTLAKFLHIILNFKFI